MSKNVTFDEFHLILLVNAELDEAACQAIQQVLTSKPFRAALRRAVRQLVRQYPALDPIQIRISV